MNLESYKYAAMCEKLAEDAEAEEKKRTRRRAAGAVAGGYAGTKGLEVAHRAAGRGVEAGLKGEKGLKNYLLGRKVQWQSNVPVTRLPLVPIAGYFPDLDRAIIGGEMKTPGVIAHEIGHGRLQRNPIGRLVQNMKAREIATKMVGRKGMPAAGVGFAAGLAADEDNKGKALAAALGIPAATAAPVLLSEAGASLSGLLALRRAGANPKQLMNAAKTLGPAFGTYATYLGRGVTMGGAGYGAGRAVGTLRKSKKDKKEKTASGETRTRAEKEWLERSRAAREGGSDILRQRAESFWEAKKKAGKSAKKGVSLLSKFLRK